ncbi:MAG: hypothetical protein QF384_07760 [Alphaproteobacteria bacterium]|jgi:hypothetical protein|nr:hypothetical protein [Alphaproteobacteria bacterium]MDP6833118.1 hypothetical protein [Alphaproteobacteria bacterium]MDP6874348.1 hypothetical protein [Alphaproteobacteria bacterium]
MKFIPFPLLLSILLAGLSACGDAPLLRDDYMGKQLIEPELMPRQVVRDEYGNPVLQPQSRDTTGFWHGLKTW